MLWKALTQDYLALELKVARGVKTRILERPGCWMPREELQQLVSDLQSVAAQTLPNDTLEYGVLSGEKTCLDRAILTVLYDETTNAPIAFNALSAIDLTVHGTPASVIHLGLVMIAPPARRRGLSWVLYTLTCLLLLARNQFRPVWFSNVTQVPAIIGMTTEGFADVFPSPKPQARCSFDHLVIAREIMAQHRHVFGVGPEAGFNEETFVIADAYTGGSDSLKKTFAEAPKAREEIYNRFCKEKLDYDRGDDFLQIGRLDFATASSVALKDVPRRSALAVAGALAVVSINRLILPVVFWFSSNRPWGILRPAIDMRGAKRS